MAKGVAAAESAAILTESASWLAGDHACGHYSVVDGRARHGQLDALIID
jgi:hypothetical protein